MRCITYIPAAASVGVLFVILFHTVVITIGGEFVLAFLESPLPLPTSRRQNLLLSNKLLAVSNDDTDTLLEKARKLRNDVQDIETSKLKIQKEKEAKERQLKAEEDKAKHQMNKQRLRYSVEVPILKDMGEEVMERIDFPPRLKGGKSHIVAVQAPLPLGLVLGEEASLPGLISIDEVAADSNAEVAGIKQGDIVRAITACQPVMSTPTWQLLAGGIGQPKIKRFIYSVDGRPLEEVLEAVGSNRMDSQERDVWLVLETID